MKPDSEKRIAALEQKLTALQWMLHIVVDTQASAALRVLHETLRLQLEHPSLDRRPLQKGMLVSFYAAIEAELRSRQRGKRSSSSTRCNAGRAASA